MPKGELDSNARISTVPVGQLRISGRPDYVYAVQELCTSAMIAPDVSVTMGKMTLSTDPNQVAVDSTRTVKVIANSVDWKVVHQPRGTTMAPPKGIETKVALPCPRRGRWSPTTCTAPST